FIYMSRDVRDILRKFGKYLLGFGIFQPNFGIFQKCSGYNEKLRDFLKYITIFKNKKTVIESCTLLQFLLTYAHHISVGCSLIKTDCKFVTARIKPSSIDINGSSCSILTTKSYPYVRKALIISDHSCTLCP